MIMIFKHLKLKKRESYIIILTFILFIAISSINNNFVKPEFITELFGYNGVFFVCALGVLPLMIMRGFDLSVGGMMLVISAFISLIISYIQLPLFLILILCVSFGSILGSLNGQLISRLNVSAIIVTLGLYSIYRGVARFWFRQNNNANISILSVDFETITFIGISLQNWLIIVMIIVTFYLLKYHPLGRGIFAFGGNEELAVQRGFSKHKLTKFVYTYSGMAAGLASFLHMSLLGHTSIEAYSGIEFKLIIIVILGGLNILGGYGSVLGTVFATIFVVMLRSGLVFAKVPASWHDMLIGLIILLVVSYDMLKRKINIENLISQEVVQGD